MRRIATLGLVSVALVASACAADARRSDAVDDVRLVIEPNPPASEGIGKLLVIAPDGVDAMWGTAASLRPLDGPATHVLVSAPTPHQAQTYRLDEATNVALRDIGHSANIAPFVRLPSLPPGDYRLDRTVTVTDASGERRERVATVAFTIDDS
ncbi:MAG TPA: hypothetical protein VF230_08255 [Acidimicrobiales bacterium]